MATELINGLVQGRFSSHRIVEGAPVVADPTQDSSHLLNTKGYESALVVPIITGGAAPTVRLTPYLYDPDTAAFYPHVESGNLSSGQPAAFATLGFKVFLAITNVTGNPTKVELLVGPGIRSRATEE